MSITEGEILELLAASAAAGRRGPPEARTAGELMEMAGIGCKRLYRAFRALHREGRLGVHKVLRPTIDGRTVPVVAYTIKPKPRRGARR